VNNDEEFTYIFVVTYDFNNLPTPFTDSVKVVVYVPPKITTVPNRRPNVYAGQSITLICNASGDPMPNITWTREGFTEAEFNVSVFKLHLVNVQRKDIGGYKCTADNGYGTATSLSVLNINCPNQCKVVTVGIRITEGAEWSDALGNRRSVEFETLETNLTSEIASLYSLPNNAGKQLYELEVVNFWQGSSIWAIVQLHFKEGVSDPLQPLRDAVSDGRLGPFTVDRQLDLNPISTKPAPTDFDSVSTEPTPTENDSGSREVHPAVYISVTIFVLIFIVIVMFFLWRRRIRARVPPETSQQVQTHQIIQAPGTNETPRGDFLIFRNPREDPTGEEQPADYDYPSVGIYMPLNPSTMSWEINREEVTIIKIIGRGAFSEVAKATVRNCLRSGDGNTTVAVKKLKANAPDSDRRDLLSELELMKTLKPHPHVIKLMGCVTESDPLMVLIEYIPFGDLLGYLRKSRGLNDTYYKDPDVKPQTCLTAEQLMKFAWQVADGMCYLAFRKIIHRDLAARNVLVGKGEKCKVTDFGMARDVHQDNIYIRNSCGRLPVKWTAYEALMYGTYTTQSDVWSYGVLLYEILTVGGSPYPDINAREIPRKLEEGYRMPKPKHVNDKLYMLMLKCWEEHPNERPTFSDLRVTLKEMEGNHPMYVNLSEYDNNQYANLNDLTAG